MPASDDLLLKELKRKMSYTLQQNFCEECTYLTTSSSITANGEVDINYCSLNKIVRMEVHPRAVCGYFSKKRLRTAPVDLQKDL